MLERDKYKFLDTDDLVKTQGIQTRANAAAIKSELQRRFPGEIFENVQVTHHADGKYQGKTTPLDHLWGSGHNIEGLPDYYEVSLSHRTGAYCEELIVWSPAAWNDRFAGTAGGGTGIGGRSYLTVPDDTARGWMVPYAVMNGFTAATMYAGNGQGIEDLILDHRTGEFRRELYENWRVRSTHDMTIFGKAIAEFLHDRPVRWSYMNGGSGGGRQSMMEVQNYPEDYDGVWAACPAIYWNHFLLAGFWPVAVMNHYQYFLSHKKNQFFVDQAHLAAGGKEAFYHLQKLPDFDAGSCIGMKSPGGIITAEDARVMNEIWRGPHTRDGKRLWYTQAPGVKNWNVINFIGTYYYPLPPLHKIKPFPLAPRHARWITGKTDEKFGDITPEKLVNLFARGTERFSDSLGDNPAIDAFVNRGGKLMIDHGLDDPLIPPRGTIAYYDSLCRHFGSQETVDKFCRLYITPGDTHGSCKGNGPGIKESTGMLALMNWVENGIAPGKLSTVRVDARSGALLEKGVQAPYRWENDSQAQDTNPQEIKSSTTTKKH